MSLVAHQLWGASPSSIRQAKTQVSVHCIASFFVSKARNCPKSRQNCISTLSNCPTPTLYQLERSCLYNWASCCDPLLKASACIHPSTDQAEKFWTWSQNDLIHGHLQTSEMLPSKLRRQNLHNLHRARQRLQHPAMILSVALRTVSCLVSVRTQCTAAFCRTLCNSTRGAPCCMKKLSVSCMCRCCSASK